jgi:hypothetical protein
MWLGVCVCLIPNGLVNLVGRRRPRSRLGRAADVGLLILIVTGLIAGLASQARAQGEHVKPARGMGDTSVGWASMNRPNNDAEADAMKELLCPCGCKRESVFICKCQTASSLRAWIVELVNEPDKATGAPRFNLSTKDGREAAYNHALDQYVAQYGTQSLSTPRSSFSWLFPSLGVIGGLGLLFVESVSRRDYTLVQALVLLVAFVYVFVNFFVDLLYAWLDPRIRYQ